MKLLLEKFNFTINIEENKHTVIAYSLWMEECFI